MGILSSPFSDPNRHGRRNNMQEAFHASNNQASH
jgi:hypothetical protein